MRNPIRIDAPSFLAGAAVLALLMSLISAMKAPSLPEKIELQLTTEGLHIDMDMKVGNDSDEEGEQTFDLFLRGV